jgi:hypothetical protein
MVISFSAGFSYSVLYVAQICSADKKKRKFSSYIRKFLRPQLKAAINTYKIIFFFA